MHPDSIPHPMRRLFQYLGNYRGPLSQATAASVVNKIFDLMPPFLTAWFIDSVSGNPPSWLEGYLGYSSLLSIITFLSVLTLFIFGMESFFEWLFKRGFLRLAQRVQHDLRMVTYRKMQSREMAFFENQRTGNLMTILNDDINQLERFINSIFNEIIQLVVLLLFAGWALIVTSLELGLIGMIPIPIIVVGSFFYQRKVAPLYKKVREQVGWLGARLENNISGIQVIKSFTAEKFEESRVREASVNYRDANFQAIRWSAVFIPIIRMFIALGFTATLYLGAYWVIYEPGRFTVGGLAFFAMMIQRLLWPVTRLGFIFDEYERARAASRRIFALLDAEPKIKNPSSPAASPRDGGTIRWQEVSFSYSPEQTILKNINLNIRQGETIGIAGPTGSGKTTFIKLLMRLYDVDQGSISLDGHDLRELTIRDLRRCMALVSQEVYLFHGTIEENIAYGMEEASLEEIRAAAQKAQLHTFIDSLPLAYKTIVGERGIKLSGGQRQRLSIARAILKNAPIIILDEATSAVDTETEKAIQHNLDQLTQNKTAIIVAHRLSTIRQADRILVFDQGRIVEQGSHEELLAQKGTYQELWHIQTGEVDK
ncbi:MAG TPA: ABC transporter ATP-binding protein [Saprospiraceae bacterium]|nr:ABC transporter ATP-binding protein [Saprospiraceae bacterium]